MTTILKSAMTAAAGVFFATSVSAADLAPAPAAPPAPLWDIAFGMKLANDYVFRGIDQTNGQFTAQGYVEGRAFDWIYAGVWTSNVSFPAYLGFTNPSAEVDLYGGIRHTWDKLTLDVGALYYSYPNQINQPGLYGINYFEVYFKPTYVINDMFTIGASVFYTPNYLNTDSPGTYVSGSIKMNLPKFLPWDGVATYISAEGAGQFLEQNRFGVSLPSYATWNVGIGATLSAMTLDLRYIGNSLSNTSCGVLTGVRNWCGQRFVASLSFDSTLLTLGQ